MRAIRKVNPEARLIQTEDGGRSYGSALASRQAKFENHRRWLTFDLLTGRVTRGHPLWKFLLKFGASRDELAQLAADPTPPSVIGINYYVTSDRFLDEAIDRYPANLRGGNGRIAYADIEAVRRRSEGIAGHHTALVDAWKRYGLPVALTEVHLACTREEQLRWLHEAWQAALAAQMDGADVVAITPWALLGSYDWDSLVTEPRGHYECGAFDVRAPAPRRTALASLIRQLSGRGRIDLHLSGQGWWRRPERLIDAPAMPLRRTAGHQRLLVLGPSGTLGAAFLRIAQGRGLAAIGAGRQDVDIADRDSLRRLFRAVKPWAVINATGYVRVDEAQGDSEACFDVNTRAAVNIAAICAELHLPLASFSSDLVFDGLTSRPYTEEDSPNPLSVYGASKAQAEQGIRQVMPEALIVRTSAFFGPWDSHNFVAQALSAIKNGDRWRAAADIVVTPTYVPDLVNAALDLLQDRERGIWHLSNEGPVSWYELARCAAAACGARVDLIDRAYSIDLGWPAPRPAYSALGSTRGKAMRSTPDALAAFALAA